VVLRFLYCSKLWNPLIHCYRATKISWLVHYCKDHIAKRSIFWKVMIYVRIFVKQITSIFPTQRSYKIYYFCAFADEIFQCRSNVNYLVQVEYIPSYFIIVEIHSWISRQVCTFFVFGFRQNIMNRIMIGKRMLYYCYYYYCVVL